MTDGLATAPGAGGHSGKHALEARRARFILALVGRGSGPVLFDHVIRSLARR